MAKSPVQRTWAAHKPQPHRVCTFKRSRDPAFPAKPGATVGPSMAPPRHAVVLPAGEEPQIQALGRTRSGPPPKPGRCATMTRDCGRNGTTALLAALGVLDGTVLGRCMRRHRRQGLIRFPEAVEAAVPAGKLVRVILDNHGTRKHAKVLAWLERHPRWTLRFAPIPGSPPASPDAGRGAEGSGACCARWLNAVETFLSAPTRRRLRRGVLGSIVELQAAIHRHIAEHNNGPAPFVWTKSSEQIAGKLDRLDASVP